MGTFPAFLSAWGPIDFSFGSGQGVKCVRAEHFYGEYWQRAFIVGADTPHTCYIVSFGANVDATGGTCAITRHADAMDNLKRILEERTPFYAKAHSQLNTAGRDVESCLRELIEFTGLTGD